jgi:hypothetical protein
MFLTLPSSQSSPLNNMQAIRSKAFCTRPPLLMVSLPLRGSKKEVTQSEVIQLSGVFDDQAPEANILDSLVSCRLELAFP